MATRRAGDLLGGSTGLTTYTPQMAAQGVPLLTSNATRSIGDVMPAMGGGGPGLLFNLLRGRRGAGSQGPVEAPHSPGFGDFLQPTPAPTAAPTAAPTPAPEIPSVQPGLTDPRAGQKVAGMALIGPEDIREKNPFNPNQLLTPEDDAMTPPGMLAPSEIKEVGGFFNNLGKMLENPANQKLLAAIGMSLAPGSAPIGHSIIEGAESTAQQQFRQGLEGGLAAGDILTPGLSPEGRKSVLQEFEQGRLAEQQQTRLASQEERLGRQEDRLTNVANLEMQRIEQQLEKGEIDKQTADLQLTAMRKAQEFSNTSDPNLMIREGAKAIGIKIPESLDVSQFTPAQTMDLLQEMASLSRVRENIAGTRKSKNDAALLTEAQRSVRIKTFGQRLSELRGQFLGLGGLREGGAGAERTGLRRQIAEAENEILRLGGDPSEFTPAQLAGGEEAAIRQAARERLKLSDKDIDEAGIEKVKTWLKWG